MSILSGLFAMLDAETSRPPAILDEFRAALEDGL
jgi:hypothetical protein